MEPGNQRDQIRSVVAVNAGLSVDIDSLADDADLYSAGMASHDTVTLMLALEDAFDIEFPDVMLRRAVFETVDAIAGAIGSLLPAGS